MPGMTPTPPPPDPAVRLGILSDTHGRADACRLAVRILLDMGANAFAHCGDVGAKDVLDALAGHAAWFVWGNNDFDRPRLAAYARDIGLECLDDFGRFNFAGRQFAITHGDQPGLVTPVRRAAEAGQAPQGVEVRDDYLLTGHTHVSHDRRIGRLRWINPGALYRARPLTVALLDASADELVVRPIAVAGR